MRVGTKEHCHVSARVHMTYLKEHEYGEALSAPVRIMCHNEGEHLCVPAAIAEAKDVAQDENNGCAKRQVKVSC